ncbi:MAG: hypothetical protein DMF20_06885 [Verrucomicrobia bacterium]|nr:MAG: hypothetical protein DME48_02490 [Verrucomicrobiota bacterium]PYL66324.1 MAG: hypothetical protein DMF20_06885 [Verrucomicrobiota bacterium]
MSYHLLSPRSRMPSAKGASFILSLGRCSRFHGVPNASAESAIHVGTVQLIRAFSAGRFILQNPRALP